MAHIEDDIKVDDLYNLATEVQHRYKYRNRTYSGSPIAALAKSGEESFPTTFSSPPRCWSSSHPVRQIETKIYATRPASVNTETPDGVKRVKWLDIYQTRPSTCDDTTAPSRESRELPKTYVSEWSDSPRSVRRHGSHDSMSLLRYRNAARSMEHACIRTESRVNPELSSEVNPLSRQVCEVLGPAICHICGKNETRDHSVECCASQFPSIHISEDHFKKALLLKKYMPHLSTQQLQEKISNGEVAIDIISSNGKRPSTSSERSKLLHVQRMVSKWKNRTISPEGCSWTYFANIRHLSGKISSGILDKMAEANPEEYGHYVKEKKERLRKALGYQLPSFLSYESAGSKTDQKYPPLYYEPPVISMIASRDRSKHDFFTSKKGAYKLPERLPENVIPPDVIRALEQLYEDVKKNSTASNDSNIGNALEKLHILAAKSIANQKPILQQ